MIGRQNGKKNEETSTNGAISGTRRQVINL